MPAGYMLGIRWTIFIDTLRIFNKPGTDNKTVPDVTKTDRHKQAV